MQNLSICVVSISLSACALDRVSLGPARADSRSEWGSEREREQKQEQENAAELLDCIQADDDASIIRDSLIPLHLHSARLLGPDALRAPPPQTSLGSADAKPAGRPLALAGLWSAEGWRLQVAAAAKSPIPALSRAHKQRARDAANIRPLSIIRTRGRPPLALGPALALAPALRRQLTSQRVRRHTARFSRRETTTTSKLFPFLFLPLFELSSAPTYLERLVAGSFIIITSLISPYLPK